MTLAITRTPLRVSFIGGGTDIAGYYSEHGGAVVSSTIDKYVYVMARPRWDGRFVIRLAETQIADRAEDITHGLTRECLRLLGVAGGIDITSMADVPTEGCGLGSSSAYTVGLLAALLTLAGEPVDPRVLAELACRVEIDMLAEPIGKQDQYAAAFGGCNEFRFERDGSVTVRPIGLGPVQRAELTAHAALFFTGSTRRAAAALRRWRPDDSANVPRLHVIKDAVPVGRRLIEAGDMRRLGHLLDLNWQQKRRLGDGGDDTLADRIHSRGVRAGAYGGKLLGAGGGGYFLFLCPPSRQDVLAAALTEHPRMPFNFVDHGCAVVHGPAPDRMHAGVVP